MTAASQLLAREPYSLECNEGLEVCLAMLQLDIDMAQLFCSMHFFPNCLKLTGPVHVPK